MGEMEVVTRRTRVGTLKMRFPCRHWLESQQGLCLMGAGVTA